MKIPLWLKIVVLIAVATAVCFFLFKVGLLAGTLSRNADQLGRDTHALLVTANGVLGQAGVVLDNVNDATTKVAAAADQQTAYWQKTQQQVYRLIVDTKDFMGRTDISLNKQLIPRLDASLDAATTLETRATENLSETTRSVNSTIAALQPGILDLNRAAAGAAAAMSDPAIHETLTHLDGVAGNADATSADVHAFVHRETTPVRGTWNVIKAFLAEFAGPLAQVATAAK